MTANINKPEQITALYARLSQADAVDGVSGVTFDRPNFNFMQRAQTRKSGQSNGGKLHFVTCKKRLQSSKTGGLCGFIRCGAGRNAAKQKSIE